GLLSLKHGHLDAARLHIGGWLKRAGSALPDLCAAEGRFGPFHGEHNIEKTDALRRPGEPVAAVRARHGLQHLGGRQRLQMLEQIALRKAVQLRERARRQRPPFFQLRQNGGTVNRRLNPFAQSHFQPQSWIKNIMDIMYLQYAECAGCDQRHLSPETASIPSSREPRSGFRDPVAANFIGFLVPELASLARKRQASLYGHRDERLNEEAERPAASDGSAASSLFPPRKPTRPIRHHLQATALNVV